MGLNGPIKRARLEIFRIYGIFPSTLHWGNNKRHRMKTTLIAYFPLIVLAVIYIVVCVLNAAYIKLSGRILHGSVVSWKDSFVFALAITFLILVLRIAAVAEGISAPLTLALALGFVLYLTFGGWFFSTRGVTKQGQPLGWLGGIQLSALVFVLLALTGVLVNEAVRIIANA
jgi:hypothetical protein